MNKKLLGIMLVACIATGVSLYTGIFNKPATVVANAVKQETNKPSCSPNANGCTNINCDNSSCESIGNICTPGNSCSENSRTSNGSENISNAALQSYGELMKRIESSAAATAQPSAANTNSLVTNQQAATSAIVPLGTNYKALQSKIFELTNIERQKNGSPPLVYNSAVEKYAVSKSQDMAINNYFDHKSPTNGYFYDIWTREGFKYSAGAENIYFLSDSQGFANRDINVLAKKIVDGWMGSESHRQNILSNKIKEIGVGVAGKDDRLYTTQLFYIN